MQFAMDIAQKTGASITVLHVVFPNEGMDNNVYNVFWSDEYMAERTKGLENWARRFKRKKEYQQVPVSCDCQIGFPVPSICSMADKINADIIIMGTTGATGLRGAFLGSIAAGVLAKTQRPVLSIPKSADLAKGKDIVFSTDFRFRIDDRSMQVLQDIQSIKKGKLRIVHIMDKPGEERNASREHTLSQKLGNLPHDFHYLHDRDIAQAVSNFIESTDASMIIAVAHEHSLLHRLFFDSVTRRLAHRIQIPLLALHDAT